MMKLFKVMSREEKALKLLEKTPRYSQVSTDILGSQLLVPDASSFVFMYKEIFQKEIYNFRCNAQCPYIIDAGANIGLSTIYFKRLFPAAEVLAFEADPHIAELFNKNVAAFGLSGVTCVPKALWDTETILEFVSEGADAGRIGVAGINAPVVKVPATTLGPYLQRHVDFLKVDIEGAELKVLRSCRQELKQVDNLFIEYHSILNEPQGLGELMAIIEEAGFRYFVNSPGFSSAQPFITRPSYLGMDMQLNIYAFRRS